MPMATPSIRRRIQIPTVTEFTQDPMELPSMENLPRDLFHFLLKEKMQ